VISEVGKFLNEKDLVFEGGQCSVGVESTIIDCMRSRPIVLRPGAITLEMINILIASEIISDRNPENLKASGLLSSHYSPKANVELGGVTNLNDGFIAMANFLTPKGAIRLASPVNVEEYAQRLYEALRLGDSLNLNRIVIHPPEGQGLAAAVRDRLEKAAHKIL
jgi:L-threonylcarbamoyladenylate synthase